MSKSNFKRGDVVGYVFAQPGNDTTYMLLTDVRTDDADAWDLMFGMEIKAVKLAALWRAKEHEMAITTLFSGWNRAGSFTVQQLADEARQKIGIAE